MKLTAILIVIGCLQVNAKATAQNISISQRNTTLQKVFKEIHKKTGYQFFYQEELLQKTKRFDIDIKNASVEQVLEVCFKDQPISFTITENAITITKKENPTYSNASLPTPLILIKITGKVTNQKGVPLAAATILEKGTKNATTTNTDGSFSFNVENSESKLVVSYIGYISKEIVVGTQNFFDIILDEADNSLSDVVLVGYGTQRKTDLTGSISTIKVTDIDGPSLPSFQQALQGRVSGVQVAQTGGALDGRFSVTIRGVGSINSGTEPLYVVDGVPLFSAELSTINPNDIATMTILKDASATAIYGSRAANGVIIITTIAGKPKSSKIIFSDETGIEQVAKLMKMLTSDQQRQLTFDAFTNSGLPTAGYDNPNDPLWKVDNNWQKLITRTAFRQNYTLGVYGGSENTQYGVSANYLDREGVLKNTELKLWSLRANLDHAFNDRFKIHIRLSGSYQKQKVANSEGFLGGDMQNSLDTHSHIPLYDSLGNFSAATTSGAPYWGSNNNVLAELLENDRTINDARLLGNIKMDYILTSGLTLSGTFGGDILSENARSYFPVYQRGVTKRVIGDLTQTSTSQINWLADASLNYNKTFNQHHEFTAVLGSSLQQFNNVSNSVHGTGTTNNLLNQLTNQTTFTATGFNISSGLVSAFMRINYAYDKRYLLTATVRRDGSSKFPSVNHYGTFPSASVGWRISKEKFYHSNVFTDLKLRTSYGLTGNQDIADFAYITKAGAANYVLGNNIVLGNAAVNQGTPDLKWESSKQLDIGSDVEMFYGRINLTMDYYDKRSEGLLINIPLPATSGISQATTVNLGSVKNSGFELGISSKNTVGEFKWSTDFNISFNKNRVLDIGKNALGQPFQIPGTLDNFFTGVTNLTEAGKPIGAFYMYVWDGIWQTKDAAAAAAFSGARPGDMKYKDVNGDGKFTAADKKFVAGSPQPTYYGGINNNFEYKNWDLSIFINGAGGNKKINTVKFLHGGGWPFNQELAEVKNRWTPTNPSNSIPAANQLGNSTFLATQMSTYFLQDASFLRLKNISLTYNVGKSFLQRTKLEGVKFMLSASNLLTFTKYEGYDPEASSLGNQLSAGIDYAPYPLSKVYTLSVQVTF